MSTILSFILGLKLGLFEWLAIALGALAGIQTLRLKRSKQDTAEAEQELFKNQLLAGEPERKARLEAQEKETENARSKFKDSSGAYESARGAWRPGDGDGPGT